MFTLSVRTIALASLVTITAIAVPKYLNRNMPTLSVVRASNSKFSPNYFPVAVFVAGTGGIGQGTLEAFARATKGNAHIIIVGRNEASAQSIFSSLPKPSGDKGQAKYEFVKCDVTLMANVRQASQQILAKAPKMNFLYMSPGVMTTNGRNETEEGIDRKMAVHYYARFMFIKELLPALTKAKEAGEDAKVFSVLSAGKGGPINEDDLGLKKTFSLSNAAMQSPTYNDLMHEKFASQTPGITFAHAYPGGVRTGLFKNSDTAWMRTANSLLMPLAYPITVTQEECGEHMLYAMLNYTGGAKRVGSKGEDIGMKRYYGTDEQREKLWEHTLEATKSK